MSHYNHCYDIMPSIGKVLALKHCDIKQMGSIQILWEEMGADRKVPEERSVNEKSESHGLIERNQRDRESYHQEQEERKQVSETQPAGTSLLFLFPALG